MRLSRDFTLEEFTRSQTAERMGRPIVVEPGSMEHRNLEQLCGVALQPMRDALGLVSVTSGIRPVWLNEMIGGSPTSDHVPGLAGDVVVPGRTPLEVAKWAAANLKGCKQIIHEFGRWVHISVWPEGQTGECQLLTAYKVGKKTVYTPGLHAIETLTRKVEE